MATADAFGIARWSLDSKVFGHVPLQCVISRWLEMEKVVDHNSEQGHPGHGSKNPCTLTFWVYLLDVGIAQRTVNTGAAAQVAVATRTNYITRSVRGPRIIGDR